MDLLEPACNLFRRPTALEFAGDDMPELQVPGQFTGFRAMGSIPGSFVGVIRSVAFQTAVSIDFPANRRGRSIQLAGDPAQ